MTNCTGEYWRRGVLTDGFVELTQYMGDDITVVNAARVSFDKESDWQREWIKGDPDNPGDVDLERKFMTAKDVGLIKFLADNNHWTPFGHCMATLRIKLPIFVARQWMRSNIGIVYNEISRRYVESEPEFYNPLVWRGRPTDGAKQGSAGEVEYQVGSSANLCLFEYRARLKAGICPEQARMCLPVNMFTEFWMTGSLMAFARVIGLRVESHAQWETQQYAIAVAELIRKRFPIALAALLDEDELPTEAP